MVAAKRCTKCGIVKILDEFNIQKDKSDQSASSCKECHREWYKRYYDDNLRTPETIDIRRKSHLKRRYNLTTEQFDAMLAAQNNKCAVCERELESRWHTNIDHDHACCPGKKSCGKCIRALLCSSCNQGIGYLQDSPEILLKAVQYLQSHAS